MARVTIVIEDVSGVHDDGDAIRATIESDPPFEPVLTHNTDAQGLAMLAYNAVIESGMRLLGGEPFDLDDEFPEGE